MSEIQEGDAIILTGITRPLFAPVPSQECRYIIVLSQLLVLLTLVDLLIITVSVCNVILLSNIQFGKKILSR